MEQSGKPPCNPSLPMMKALLAYLPVNTAKALLPLIQMMELQELLQRFHWERTTLFSAVSEAASGKPEQILDAMLEHASPEQREQFEQMRRMMDMLSMMQNMETMDPSAMFANFDMGDGILS